MDKRKQLISIALKAKGDYNLIRKYIQNNECFDMESDDNAITIFDDEYPRELLELKNPPFVLFYKGNLGLLKEDKISVVGSRNPCEYAKLATKVLVEHQRDKVIVSGLAKGIDYNAHLYATKTIGVLGCGINYVYPKENSALYKRIINEGLIISEYPDMSLPYAFNFPFRNRIIAALGKEMYIMEAHDKSGTMTSINEALELGKEVKVLPFDLFNPSGYHNNCLINEGASMISHTDLGN